MSSALVHLSNLGGARFGFLVARPTKRHKIFWRVGFGNSPRNNVVNVQLLALAGKRTLRTTAFTARISVTLADFLSGLFPCNSAPVMLRRATLPPVTVGTSPPNNVSQNIAVVGAKSPSFAIKAAKLFPAPGTFYDARFLATPSRAVVASHVAEKARFGVIGICLKGLAAAFAGFLDAGLWSRRLTGLRAILPPPVSAEHLAALFARFFHSLNIVENPKESKYFDIACRRVEEAARQPDLFVSEPQPVPKQDTLDL